MQRMTRLEPLAMKNNFLILGRTVCLSLLCGGCATIFTGKTDEVTFTSEPPGATVVVGESRATTPATMTIQKSEKEVRFQQAGQPERKLALKRDFKAGYLLMDILFTPGFGLSGLIIDGATSAWYDHPGIVHCDFTKPEESVAVPASAPKPTQLD